jgi:hypothetical protein
MSRIYSSQQDLRDEAEKTGPWWYWPVPESVSRTPEINLSTSLSTLLRQNYQLCYVRQEKTWTDGLVRSLRLAQARILCLYMDCHGIPFRCCLEQTGAVPVSISTADVKQRKPPESLADNVS